MTILCTDDEQFALKSLTEAVRAAAPDAAVKSFATAAALLDFARSNACDAAFLDIEMRDMNGLALAKQLKEYNPRVNIIFVTGYSQYAGDAFGLRASGYVMKPVTPEKITAELENLRNPPLRPDNGKLQVQCFGNFEVYRNGVPLNFPRTRDKEVLAYLVFKRGSACSLRELSAVLYEDEPYTMQQRDRTRQLIFTMTQTLREANAADVLVKRRNSIAVDPEAVDCDYYRFLDMDVHAINAYMGEFMSQYEWAVFTTGFLDRQK